MVTLQCLEVMFNSDPVQYRQPHTTPTTIYDEDAEYICICLLDRKNRMSTQRLDVCRLGYPLCLRSVF